MGIKRGRKPLGKKQINIRLLPEHYTLLENPNPIFVYYRKAGVNFKVGKHGKSNGYSASDIVGKLIHDKMLEIIRADPAAILDFAQRHPVHARWLRVAYDLWGTAIVETME
jgi:hypothetical protein